MNVRLIVLCTALVLLLATPAWGASTVVVRGAGFGHGVGMSQYGALGFAQQGVGYRDILGHYYTDTRLGRLNGPSEVRVLMQSAGTVRFDGAVRVAGGRGLQPSTTYRVTRGGANRVTLRSPTGRSLGTYNAPLRVQAGASGIRLLGRAGNGITSGRYRGAFELRPGTFSGVNAINAVELEDYVRGVVSGESPASWPAEALKAQSVAARTYAITTNKPGTGFDHYPDTRSQVYNGVQGERTTTDAAIAATHREVVTYDGKPVVTYFFSTSGGKTENVENSFIGAKPQPWLKGVRDPYDKVSPRHRWGPTRYSIAQATARLRGLVKGKLIGVEVKRRGSSPRIVAAEVVGTRGRTRVTGPQLRTRFGAYDHWMYFNVITTDAKKPTPQSDPERNGKGGASPGARDAAAPSRSVLRGRVHPAKNGTWLTVQRRQGGKWRLHTKTVTDRNGRYDVPVSKAGSFRVLHGKVAGPAVRVR
jgi:stage II sporulation protein D